MALSTGSSVGPYEILGPLGAGGMGEVYRARDAKLGRLVALKILPDAFARDPERMARFEREARTLASLNHAHIAQIYGLEENEITRALVMELVEGEDLAQRIARGRIPLDEALAIARQIADGLEAAHELGIIHRDLKPANVKLRPDGTVKILDFGLAKAVANADTASGGLHDSPTITSPAALTLQGVVLGTAAYMSPEQAKGRAADPRSDIWAFGCVLYEMLTGSRAFDGQDVTDSLAAILRSEPAWDALPADTPSAVRALLRRCLQKDPKRRLRHIGDAALDLDEAAHAHDGSTIASAGSPRFERWAWALALALAVSTAAALAYVLLTRDAASRESPETIVELTTSATTDPTSFALAPDGRSIAYVDAADGRARLLLRSLGTGQVRVVPGTEGASLPFWSPDGQTVAFFSDDGRLKSIGVQSGSLQNLAGAPLPRGGAWSHNNVIIYAPATGPIFRLPAAGGAPVALTQMQLGHASHSFPSFLPDERHFLYFVPGVAEVRGVYVGDIDGSDNRRLFDAESPATYVGSGHVLFVRGDTLYAQQFDPARLELVGSPARIADRIARRQLAAVEAWAISASSAGAIAYRTGVAERGRQFVWVDRAGKAVSTVNEPDLGMPLSAAMSPDGRRLALHRTVGGNADIWLLELARGGLTRFTTDAANDIHPSWSPDGTRIYFHSNRSGAYLLYQKPVASGIEEQVTVPGLELAGSVADWSADGRLLLFNQRNIATGTDVWVVPLDGVQKPFTLVRTEFEERDAQFSPDGKWIAYQSAESGRPEIYLQPFPGPGLKSQISLSGGSQVRWRRDGKELFYIALDERLVSVPIRLPAQAGAVDAGTSAPLFRVHIGGALQPASRQQYFVSEDGQRFLLNTVVESGTPLPLSLILNWRPPGS